MDVIQIHWLTSFTVTFVTLLLTVYIIYVWLFAKPSKNLPPGPRGWSDFVDIVKATQNETLHELATEWAKKYGPITYVNFMGNEMAFLNTVDVARRVYGSDQTKNAVADRRPITVSKLAFYNGKDLLFTPYDAIGKSKRRILHKVIGLFGDGVAKFERVVSGEMDRLLSELQQFENQDIDLCKYVSRSLKIIIYILVLGEHPDDITKPDILEEYDIAINKLWAPDHDFVITNVPILAKLPGKYKRAMDRLRVTKKAAEDMVFFGPKKSWKPGQPRGICDLLLDLQNKPGNEWMQKNQEYVIAFLTSIFLTAHLTSRATLNGGFLCLLNHPRVVKKIQEEIDIVLGDRQPKIEDRSAMPYTEATFWETLRLISQGALAGMRLASEDINIDGTIIPKNTVIYLNTWFFHHDEQIWEDPWSFKPERFLDSNGHMLPADSPVRKNLLPFGFGVRSCPGEFFAKARLFMFFTSILQKYDLLPPKNGKLVPADFRSNDEAVKGFVRQTLPYKCRLRRRRE